MLTHAGITEQMQKGFTLGLVLWSGCLCELIQQKEEQREACILQLHKDKLVTCKENPV